MWAEGKVGSYDMLRTLMLTMEVALVHEMHAVVQYPTLDGLLWSLSPSWLYIEAEPLSEACLPPSV